MRLFLLFASTALASGMLFTNMYTSMVDARSWGASIPDSIKAAREYFKTVNPGKNFFRIFSPPNVIVALLTLILFWGESVPVRIYLAMALALYVSVEAFTFGYFYPRNAIMFETSPFPDTATLIKAQKGWSTMNWLRSFFLFAGLVCSFMAMYAVYTAR